MPRHITLPDQAALNKRYSYNPETGQLTWRITSANGQRKPGDTVGKRQDDGTLAVKFNGVWFFGHRLIWVMVTGDDPGEFVIDHRDGDPSNNRFQNLRMASHVANSANRGHTRGRGLPKGVVKIGSRFVARIGDGGKDFLGSFEKSEEAEAAYLKEAHRRWGAFATTGGRVR
jgi:hypothetical protein